MAPIYFYSTIEAYSFLSNFSPHGFELDGRYWPTAEHYYQAQKFAGSDYAETIRRAATPHEAKELSLSPEQPVRPDWEQTKVDVMRRAVLAKFTTHAGLREALLATGDEDLIEAAPDDYFWGGGRDGTGQNMLGRLLMELRSALREE